MLLLFRVLGSTKSRGLDKKGFIILSFDDALGPKAISLTDSKSYPDGIGLVHHDIDLVEFDVINVPNSISQPYITVYIDIHKVSAYYKSKIECAFIWYQCKSEYLMLECLYSHRFHSPISIGIKSEIFHQLYPQNVTNLYQDIANRKADVCDWEELWSYFLPDEEYEEVVEKKTQELENVSQNEENSGDNIISKLDVDHAWEVFDLEDLRSIVECFSKWQATARGQGNWLDKLSSSLKEKLKHSYDFYYWKAESGIDIEFDSKPSRHTLLIGIVNTDTNYGISYCFKKPSSMDKVWSPKTWYTIQCSNNDIVNNDIYEFERN